MRSFIDDFEIDSRVTTDNPNIIPTFNLKDAVAAAREQVVRYGLLLRVRLG